MKIQFPIEKALSFRATFTKYPYLIVLLCIGLLLGSCKTTVSTITSSTENVDFIVLQMNDVYEIAPLEGGKAGGLARVATIKKQLLEENPNTIAVLSGDFLSPSFIGTLKTEEGEKIAGLQMVETLNAMGLDYATFGNHEFDISDPDLLEKRMDQSNFLYICNNAFRNAENGRRPFQQKRNGQIQPVQEYIIEEFSNKSGGKVKVGITGVVLPFNQQDYVHYEPVVSTFRKTYEQLKPKSDMVVALTHLAVEQDMQLAAEVPGVDLFLGGHDHSEMNHYVENTIITKADANAKTVYIHRISYNPASGMSRIRSTLKTIDDSIQEDPATKAVVSIWQNKVAGIMKEMGYNPDQQVLLAKTPLICTEAKVRTQPTNYGTLTVEAFQAVWPDADLYLINSGSMRLDDDISGTVTEYDVLRTFPFGGDIVRTEIPGKALPAILQTGLVTNIGQGGYLQTLNLDKKGGQWRINGTTIDPNKNYTLVLPKFLADGKEQNLEAFGEYKYTQKDKFSIGSNSIKNDIRDIVIYYMEQIKVVGE
ncbi:MAG: multifunctional 2',3'-cyclic-nucleotide 2'-phosphodiesterase/5'-nucleotidase/3'-nucleotidase [Saprospiraceae bacterium]|nr:MAG: multifunctional 2',3'-cyclic-nucleotide 2'-phosphodiesterase/5'-nucleotidase/3'-nucleotidase [Saprospiraceae bacterium]